MNSIELFGYIAMIVVLISIFMKDMIKFRIINTIACIMFIIYGALHSAMPVVIMNISVTLINAYYIISWYKTKKK